MFDMNPLNLPDAQLQQLIMLLVSAVLGFIIGYIAREMQIRRLENELVRRERDVIDCQQTPVGSPVAEGGENSVLNRIRARAGELNFERIGNASATEADDLKVIVGIGPFLEKKLNAIGIYTFRQIANFTPDDVYTVNDIIEFFPGRIERDNWVGQADSLVKQQQS